jgi:predicted nucleic acid-binding protein
VSWLGPPSCGGRRWPQNDTWIATCCLRYQVPLVTFNAADFNDFAARHGLVLLGEQM